MKADFIISFLAQLCGLNIKDPNFETLLPYTADLIQARAVLPCPLAIGKWALE